MVAADVPPIQCTVIENVEGIQTRIAIDVDKTWEPGQVITVSFLDGDEEIHEMVVQSAEDWEQYANIDFRFLSGIRNDGAIRISFNPAQGAWSYLGTSGMTVPDDYPTMNLGFREHETPWEVDRVTKHEFGHALGLIHEHQRPDNGINWDKQAVYEWYVEALHWPPSMVENNIFKVYDGNLTNSVFDPDSIMMYSIRDDWTLDDFHVDENYVFSQQDMEFIQTVYPFPEPRYVPDFSKAPEWANWWAMESNGIAWWWQKKPQLEGTLFLPRCGHTPAFDRKISNPTWYRESLRKRPGYREEDEGCEDSSDVYLPLVEV